MKKILFTGSMIAITIISSLWLIGKDVRHAVNPSNNQSVNVNPEYAMGTYSYILAQEANSGDSDSQNTLAKMYMLGVNIRPNKQRAAYWFEKAAINGNEAATVILATAYLYGGATLGIQKNPIKGVYWTKKVALCKSEERDTRILASKILGDMYSLGVEIPKNLNEASRWYKSALTLKNENGG
ncbi:MAG: tetratricopeptide repeat protein [Gammaproteobacteria bacterium]